MNEPLFRGKRIDNGEWVLGYYWYDDFCNKGYITSGNHTKLLEETKQHRIINAFEVNTKTVGRNTGLADKNDKKIFEGDIVKGFYKPTDELVCGSVKYENRLARMLILNRCVCAGLSHCYHVEVIGNIHDNPDLLQN